MRSTLHPHLKRGLDHDDFYLDPADMIEDIPHEYRNSQEQAAKRKRVEKIAAQYIKGRLPTILTASLRGPFNDGWKNPWAKEKKAKRRVLNKENSTSSDGNAVRGKAGPRKNKPTETERRTRSAGKKASEEQAVASPETSRAIHSHTEQYEESHTLDVIEVPPATAPSPDQDTSSATEFFSVDTERCVRQQSPLTDPFWLRRPESQRRVDMRTSTRTGTDLSPTHTRGNRAQPDRRKTLQLAVPKAPVGLRLPASKAAAPENLHSSASASMVISSPAHAIVPGPTILQQTPSLPSEIQPAQIHSAAETIPTLTPITSQKLPLVDHPNRGLNREAIQRSAERLVDVHSASQSSNSQSKRIEQVGLDETAAPKQSENGHPTPLMPESSTGFVYKKVGSTKWNISNAPRSKPRAVNFNSSPAGKDIAIPSKPSSQKSDTVGGKTLGALPTAVEDVLQPEKPMSRSEPDGLAQEQESLVSNTSSRQSAMSTQAAMLLAQREFQESTFPTSSSETPRPWSQPDEETPWQILPELSPAITPLSVFRPQLEQAHPLASVPRGPPLSTQDLFAAASPFAFSTIKKKSDAPQHSNLRMSLTSFSDPDEHTSYASQQSPSYSDRIPLKEKNVAPSPWKLSFEKARQNSQHSYKGDKKRSVGDVELPQLDFRTSLDDYGSTGSFRFADRLLRNPNDP
ncbi:hypothetical protein HBI56_142930 [Parastagonospora nodorum]|nr:hypothetical protein HBH49_171610 [Parastagonospora nodorum]KAH4262224.1 hypothetical protein HBI03_109950 [Parastagonospora nodorum]KAH4280995.1 hypothetical protein HBI04_051460 [Parastagonospora nodorum]KAH4294438.1 hypothetical protein HBI02_178620 [Parastagonospora nodorum]KAH4307227.1 hypothetical protein HBI01_050930 [Parastagonospora nodorum]